ncbi:MAG TPA: hypothetical protein VFR15_06685 [Chloroflexia bacterium]|nr:hypothetical protein [Chloroflexia bacterium]
MLDTFVERWCGPLLIVLGVTSLVYAVVGMVTTTAPVVDPEAPVRYIYGQRDPRERYLIWLALGAALMSVGIRLVRYFRRERARALTAAGELGR